MASGLINLSFHAADADAGRADRHLSMPTPAAAAYYGGEATPFDSDEAAARFYLAQEMMIDARPAMMALMAADTGAGAPELAHDRTRAEALTNTRVVTFHQTQAALPVFGTQTMVELTTEQGLVAINAELADPAGLAKASPTPSLTPAQALQRVADGAGVAADRLTEVAPPTLLFFHDDAGDRWHLAYFFAEVPAAPAEFEQAALAGASHHAPDPSPRELAPLLNYLVDAHDGALLFYYSAYPLLDVPTRCQGVDSEGAVQHFFGRQIGAGFELSDPLRKLKTYDMQLQNLQTAATPAQPVACTNADFATSNQAAVSAHVNAMRVYDFYKTELKRDGVDDQGMELISVVNCTMQGSTPPVWRNAVWWKNRMWYGQERGQNDQLISTARYLDIIAHELTHGVTQYTSNLVYEGQSGALNESFSDIFGVIINNWHLRGANQDVATWIWEIAPGWRDDGQPLRDLSNPRRLGAPEHMRDLLVTNDDFGGVHTNSNIHNKAAYHLLTAVDAQGQRVFAPRDAAILYYLTLTRLPPRADFAKTLQMLLQVAATYYAGDATELQQKAAAIRLAYSKVGIV